VNNFIAKAFFYFAGHKGRCYMNYLDILLAILLLIGLVRGFMKGFIFEIAVVGALFLGTYAAFKLSWMLQPYILKIDGLSPFTVNIVCSILMFALVCVGLFFLAKLFTGLVDMAALGVFNKILGAVFGMLKYAFITSVLLYFFNLLDVKHGFLAPDTKAESRLYYPVLKMSPALLPVMKEMKEKVTSPAEKWEEKKVELKKQLSN
jgi:membrane protein required for colicin V production